MKNLTKQWLDQAQYDIDTAAAMQSAGRYLYVAFLCQQTIEKDLKAAIVEHAAEHPPRIHELMRLAEIAGLLEAIEGQWQGFLADLTPFAIEARYPEYREKLSQQLDSDKTGKILTKTKELHQWLRNRMN